MMKKLGKHNTALIGMAIGIVGYSLTVPADSNISFLLIANAVKGVGLSYPPMFGLLQDSITYGQWKTNLLAISMGNAASFFAMKIGSGKFNLDPTSASAIISLKATYIWLPIIASILACVCLFLYELDKEYAVIVQDFADGKWKETSDHKDF